MKPEVKHWSLQAIQEVAADLDLEFDSRSQDWPYEAATDTDIEAYLELYDAQTDTEKMFVIMDMIIEANTTQVSRLLLDKYWIETEKRLRNNYILHAHQIYHWCDFDALRLADAWDISPKMRALWSELNQ